MKIYGSFALLACLLISYFNILSSIKKDSGDLNRVTILFLLFDKLSFLNFTLSMGGISLFLGLFKFNFPLKFKSKTKKLSMRLRFSLSTALFKLSWIFRLLKVFNQWYNGKWWGWVVSLQGLLRACRANRWLCVLNYKWIN